MPAEISAPKRAKILELYQSGLNMTEIAQMVVISRNTVAKVLRQPPGKNGPGAKSIGWADFNSEDLMKLKYFLSEHVDSGPCPTPNCPATLVYMKAHAAGFCQTCKQRWAE